MKPPQVPAALQPALLPESVVSVVLTCVWALGWQVVVAAGAAIPVFRLLPWPRLLLPLLLVPLAMGCWVAR
ncbi:MAG: hypothetical protein ACR2MZ_05470 [Candidatus Dormibacter sp.]|uniref:hypothetical protein n=1 Tax=Candidatus Dormibacter sp. TaxID=2973982 RepID=UPI000DB268BD|nr:MAG: hypothetical protein DLM66_01190 [Candidatus Dormibacteraeota bacterium]